MVTSNGNAYNFVDYEHYTHYNHNYNSYYEKSRVVSDYPFKEELEKVSWRVSSESEMQYLSDFLLSIDIEHYLDPKENIIKKDSSCEVPIKDVIFYDHEIYYLDRLKKEGRAIFLHENLHIDECYDYLNKLSPTYNDTNVFIEETCKLTKLIGLCRVFLEEN